jgi:ABC-2 type transport system ATP-binding protein
VEVSKERSLNDIFLRLSDLGIEVLSMRNKVNRLEEIFMRLVEGSSVAGDRPAERQPSAAVASRPEAAPRLRTGGG